MPSSCLPKHPLFLVIDDNESDRRRHTHLLGELGFSVVTAGDGRDGIEAFHTHRDRLVGVMTDADGAEVLAAVRQARPEIPVFVASAGIAKAPTGRRFRHAAAWLQKPVTTAAFHATMNQVVNRWLPRVVASGIR